MAEQRPVTKVRSQHSVAENGDNGNTILNKKIQAYGRNRLYVKSLMWAFILLGIGYLVVIFLQNRNTDYKEALNEGFKLDGSLVSGMDEKLIAFTATKDSLSSLFVSRDGGLHFTRLSGSWKPTNGSTKLFIGPDNNTIIIATDSVIYSASYSKDSIHQLIKPGFRINGVCFRNFSLYIYGLSPNIIEVDLKDNAQSSHIINGNIVALALDYGNGEFKLIGENVNGQGLYQGAQLESLLYNPVYGRTNFPIADSSSKTDSTNYNQYSQNVDSTKK